MTLTLHSGNRYIATAGESKPSYLGTAEEGATFWDIDNDALWQWNGTVWEQLLPITGATESFAIAMAVAL